MLKSLFALFICIKLVLSVDIASCGKYQCLSPGKNDTCVYVTAGSGRGVDHDEISLFDTCQDNQFCDPININTFSYMKKDSTFQCIQIAFENQTRYPGEDCDWDNDCIGPPQQCDQETKKCVGSKEGEKSVTGTTAVSLVYIVTKVHPFVPSNCPRKVFAMIRFNVKMLYCDINTHAV
jgi:hypothetical protein